MIVDVRCFLSVKQGELWPEWVANYGAAMAGKLSVDVKNRMKEEGKLDDTGDFIIKEMDEAGIDKAIFICFDYALTRGMGDTTSLEEYLEVYLNAVRRHPGRLYVVAGVDPRRPDATRFVEKAAKKKGVVGIGLHPQISVFPNAHYCYPVYAKCQETGLPVCIYVGPEIQPLESKSDQPILVDDPAADFPNLKFVLNKAMSAWWQEAATIARHKPNVYMDIANSQIVAMAKPRWEFYRQLRLMMSLGGPKKIMFASAWPIYRWMRPVNHVKFLDMIKNPPPEIKALDIEFSEQEIADFLGNNALRVFEGVG